MERLAITSVLACIGLLSPRAALAQGDAAAALPETEPRADEPAAPAPPEVQHYPIHEAFVGEAELRFEVRASDRAGRIVVRCSSLREPQRTLEQVAQRAELGYVASLPLACVVTPGFRYHVVQRAADGSERALFASAAEPHRVRVTHTEAHAAELLRLRARGYQRSSVLLAAELVDFGARELDSGGQLQDRYYRVEVGYAYAFYQRIEDIALTLVRVRGEGGAIVGDGATPLDPGIDFGRASVTLLAFEALRLRGSLLLGASQQGFEYGGAGELVLGDPLGEHIVLGAESITTVGSTGLLRLGFNATAAVPMAAVVELTDFPLGRDAAVRLLYEVGYRFTPVTVLLLRGGYQGRTSVIGGPSLGAALRYGF